jgi:hypothetical protein
MLNTKANVKTNTDIFLAKHKHWNIEGDRRSDVISCFDGTLWITQNGDMKDYILEAGQNFWVTKSGTVVVQALENAHFKYSLTELDSHIETNTQPIQHTLRSRINTRFR